MDRAETIETWFHNHWRISNKNVRHQKIEDYIVGVMRDHNDRNVWTWLIKDPLRGDEFSPEHFSTQDEATWAVLEELADRLGL